MVDDACDKSQQRINGSMVDRSAGGDVSGEEKNRKIKSGLIESSFFLEGEQQTLRKL